MKCNTVWINLLLVFLIQAKLINMEPVWQECNGKKYLVETEEKYTWQQALDECACYDAELVVIESEEKNNDVTSMLTNMRCESHNLWIGGNAIYSVQFIWTAIEQEFTFTNWANDNMNKKECVYLTTKRLPYGKAFPWNVDDCDAKQYGFICEAMAGEDVERSGRVKRPLYYKKQIARKNRKNPAIRFRKS